MTDKELHPLFDKARLDRGPRVDVADAVVATVRNRQPSRLDPMLIMAGSAAAAAGIILTYAVQTWSAAQDPMASLLMSMNVVLQ